MRLIIHDLDETYNEQLKAAAEDIVWADGKYAPCQGCFDCWTKNPATCSLKDSLHEMCRKLVQG